MPISDALPLFHTWLLTEREQQFELGMTFEGAMFDPTRSDIPSDTGLWSCDLASETLTWSGLTYDIFDLPRDCRPNRRETLSLYSERSRAAMDRLRTHAIRHARGFTLDVELALAAGPRWMRLIAAPVLDGPRVVRIEGVKRLLTAHRQPALAGYEYAA